MSTGRVLIVSDTHGYAEGFKTVFARESAEGLDMVLHAGDLDGGEVKLRNLVGLTPMLMVRGNNDYGTTLPAEQIFRLGGRMVLLTHGHRDHVNMGTEFIAQKALERGADVVIFGHTHEPLIEERGGVLLLNPGSVTYPRQMEPRASYILLHIKGDGAWEPEIRYVKES